MMKITQHCIFFKKMYMKNKGISLPPSHTKNSGTPKEKCYNILSNLNQILPETKNNFGKTW